MSAFLKSFLACKNCLVLVILLLKFSGYGYAQTPGDTLIGIVDGQLIKINRNDSGINNYIPVSSFPAGYTPYRLTWCEPNKCYYVLVAPSSGNYQLAKISEGGVYTLLGPVTVPAQTVYLMEGISFNRFDNNLYVSASLNGGVNSNPADYNSETLLKVDTTTLVGTIEGVFTHASPYEAEADKITFDDNGVLFYEDGQPGGGGFERFYQQAPDFLTGPVMIYNAGYVVTSDLTVKDGFMFYSSNRQLRNINLANYQHTVLNNMFTAGDFNGKLLAGITWKTTVCVQDVVVPDTSYCAGSNLTLDVGLVGNYDYLWNNGWADSVIVISAPGTYIVEVSNSTCSFQDTVVVVEHALPIINAGLDLITCLGQNVTLNAAGLTNGGVYSWNQGVTNGLAFAPMNTNDYIVIGSDLNGCENEDTVHVEVIAGVDPEFSYPNTLFCENDLGTYFPVSLNPGGTFSSSPVGLTFDSSTGEITPSTSLTGVYDITYSQGGTCPADSIVQVAVVALPVLSLLDTISVCDNEQVSYINFSSQPGVVINWANDNTAIGLGANGMGNIPAFTPTASGINQVANIVVTPELNGCIGQSETLTILVTPSPVVSVQDVAGCLNDWQAVQVSNPSNAVLTWQPNLNNSDSIQLTSSINYIVTADLNGCQSQAVLTTTLFSNPNPQFTFNPNNPSTSTPLVSFHLVVPNQNITNYYWTFGDGNTSTNSFPSNSYANSTSQSYTVQVVVVNDLGCVDSSSQVVTVVEDLIFYIPNVFTPNGDSNNNGFYPVFTSGYDYYNFHMMIFDRWGELIFETYDVLSGWDGTYLNGTIVQDGTYIWAVEFGLLDSDKIVTRKGHVTVLK